MPSKEQIYSKLKPQQLQAIALMLEGKTNTEIAKILGIRLATVSNWRNHNPAFQQALAMQLQRCVIEYRIGFPLEKPKVARTVQKRL